MKDYLDEGDKMKMMISETVEQEERRRMVQRFALDWHEEEIDTKLNRKGLTDLQFFNFAPENGDEKKS